MQLEKSASRSVDSQDHRLDTIHRSLDHLLAMAHQYQSEGNLFQATEMYWTLLNDHSGTPQSIDAQESLLKLAESYERAEARHMARAVYERLSTLSRIDDLTLVTHGMA